MATTIKLKNGSGAPLAGDLVQGEPALDLTNKRLYTEDSGGSVIEVGTNPTSLTTGTFTSTGIDDNATSTAITIDSSENVGIGLASPAAKLHVDRGASSGAYFYGGSNDRRELIISSGTGDASSLDALHDFNASGASGVLSFSTNSAERMRIDSNGTLGVGVTPATDWGDDGIQIGSKGTLSGGSSYTGYAFNAYPTSSGWASKYTTTDEASLYLQGGGLHTWYNAASGTAGTAVTWQERMRIDSSGNVGIGTTSPSALLTLSSSSNTEMNIIDGTRTSKIFTQNGGRDLQIQANQDLIINASGGTNVGIGTSSPSTSLDVVRAGALPLRVESTSGTECQINMVNTGGNVQLEAHSGNFTIDADNVGIGTTSPNYPLHLNKSDSAGCWAQFTNSTTGTGSGAGALVGIDSNEDFRILQYEAKALALYTSATERMRIDSAGRISIGATSTTKNFLLENPSTASGEDVSFRIKTNGTGSGADAVFEMIASTTGECLINFGDDNDANIGNIRYDHNINAMRFVTNTNEAVRIDSSGNVLVGTTSATGFLNSTSETGVISYQSGALGVSKSSDVAGYFKRLGNDGAIVEFRNSSATTVGAITTRSSQLAIGCTNTGLEFNDANDAVIPFDINANNTRDNAVDLGTSSVRFDDIYATNGTIQTSDANDKQDIEALSEAETRVAVAAKALLRKFRWKSAVEEKSDEARIHFGIIAQDLQAAFEAEGLDAGRYAMFIHSTWTDEETGEERSRMGVRYSELLAFIIASI